ncbi:MAG: beta-phosphoglucomutase [Deinococcales bacterium]
MQDAKAAHAKAAHAKAAHAYAAHAPSNPLYPVEPWAVRETAFDPGASLRSESIFALGNGYLGLRGTFEEGLDTAVGASVRGTYLNGFFEAGPIRYPEDAFGLARKRQTLLNVTDALGIELRVDGERFSMAEGRIEGFERVLDFRRGLLVRTLTWVSPGGRRVAIRVERLVSLRRLRVAALRYRVMALDAEVELELRSSVDGRVENSVDENDPRAGGELGGRVLATVAAQRRDAFLALRQRAPVSGLELACGAGHRLTGGELQGRSELEEDDRLLLGYRVRARRDQPVTLEKVVAYADSRDGDADGLIERCAGEVAEAQAAGFDRLGEEQREELDAFWEAGDVEVEGDDALQQSLRFGALQLFQGTGRDALTSIAAKGLTGPGYEGHLFWDAEVYVLPFFLYTRPELARAMLEHRIHGLDAARRRARELSHTGALYPWRTIDGDEASAYFPAGTAQIHINADIAHALERYLEATDDRELLWRGGAAMLFETARFWLSRGAFSPRRGGRFCIHTVTGPDEYTALVDNNLYTNLMAQGHLRFAGRMAAELEAEDGARYARLAEELALGPAEVARWREAAERMELPYDRELGVHPQDDGFLDKEPWDPAGIPPAKRPLLLHYHPLDIYRRQVLKQADVVLALYLREEHFGRAEARRDFAYYEPLTTHDSSLSPCVHGIVAARLGQVDKAVAYFGRTARMDLDDINRNVKDGVHTAAMGGTYLAVVAGFAGMRVQGGQLAFVPRLPAAWRGLRFRLAFRGRRLEVAIGRGETRYRLLEGAPLTVLHRLEPLTLEPGAEASGSNAPRLRAALLDLDGVITDTAEYHYRAWQALADRLGIPFDRQANEALRGVGRMESLELILARSDKWFSDEEKVRLADEKNRHYQELIEGITPADLLPGIEGLLPALRGAGLKLAVASASRNAPAVLRGLGLEDAFDHVVDARLVSQGKPDPEVFQRAAEALGVLDEDCVGLEDAEAGVAALRAAGMAAVGVGEAARAAAPHRAVVGTEALDLDLLRDAFAAAHGAGDVER